MAPPTTCSITAGTTGRSAASSNGDSRGGGGTGQPIAAPVTNGYRITSPVSGQQINGLVAIMGTAQFDPSQIEYFKLEIGSSWSPREWTTFGTTHTSPVSGGLLEQLHADALPPGEYVIRLVLVGKDGNFVGQPHHVPIRIGS